MKNLKQIKFKKVKPNNRTKNLIEILFDRVYVAFNDHFFLQLHQKAKINTEGFKNFVLALICYQLDTDKLLILQELTPKYKKYFDDLWLESYEFVFWGRLFTRLDKDNYSVKIKETLTSNFLSKCLHITLSEQMADPTIKQNAEEIMLFVIEVIKDELKKEWTEKLFIDDGGIVCS